MIEKVLTAADYPTLLADRDRLRDEGMMAGIGIAACLEPGKLLRALAESRTKLRLGWNLVK